MWDPERIYLVISMITYNCMHSDNQFHGQGANGLMSVPLHSILNLCTVLQISDSMSMSRSWHVHWLLPAHLQHVGLIHPHCQHTCSTTHNTHPPTNFSRLTSFCSKNHCPLVLSRYYHYQVHCVVKSVLTQLTVRFYACVCQCVYQVKCVLHHLHCHSSAVNGLQLYKPLLYMEWHDNFPLQTAQ
jgi:hypothetical protein